MSGTNNDIVPDEEIDNRVDAVKGTLLHAEENTLKRWILLAGSRGTVTFVSLLLVMLGFIVIGVLWTTEITRLMTEAKVVETLLFTLLSGTILLVSVAVSINSIVLSQEIKPIGDQKDDIEQSLEFRRATKSLTNSAVSPAQPAAFLLTVLEAVQNHAEDFRSTVPDDNSLFREQVNTFADDVSRQVSDIKRRLEVGKFGTSEVLLAGLDYDYSWQMYAVQRMSEEHADELTEEQERGIDELVKTLKQFTTGREYFKALYFKREMANLSRWLLVIAFPTIVYLSYALLALRARLIPELSLFGVPSIVVAVGVAYIIGLSPYALFTSYVLRTATIAVRTLAAGPFILESDDKRGQINWKNESVGNGSKR